MNENQMLAHKRAVDAERKAQAILRAKAQTPAGIMARIAAAPAPPPPAQEFQPVPLSVTPVRVTP